MKLEANVDELRCLAELFSKGDEIMSQFSDAAAKQNAVLDRISAALDGLTGDVRELNDKIAKLQSTPGQLSPEDQALLDEIQAKGEALANRAESLDNLTPAAQQPADTPPGDPNANA